MSAVFLEPEELAVLTGRKMKSVQVKILRMMGIPFHVNASGHPVVTRSAVEGRKEEKAAKKQWQPPE